MSALGRHRIVGHQEHGLVVLADQPVDQVHDFIGAPAVEVSSRLVAQQESGIGDDGARDAYTLLLAAGELTRIMVRAVLESYNFKRELDVLAALRLRQLGQKQRQLHILKCSQQRYQVVHLENKSHVPGAPVRELAAR